MRGWVRRAAELHGELSAVTAVHGGDPRWWLVAGGVAAAESWLAEAAYVASDAEPGSDTFIGHAAAAPADPIADAIARAHAARDVLRELDGALPDQPLAVTLRRGAFGAAIEPSTLEVAAFAIGDRRHVARLASRIEDERELALALAQPRAPCPEPGAVPFVTVTLGEESIETARHGHRRGWLRNGVEVGPWLGLGRAGGLAVVSTSHLVVDGYGHAWLAARIAERAAQLTPRAPRVPAPALPPPAYVPGSVPLAVAWRALPGRGPRALPLAYALGRWLHAQAGLPDARFSPTFQIPVAPGAPGDPQRRRRRVVPAIASVRFDDGAPERFTAFEARVGELLRREAIGQGLTSRLLAAARGAPAPLAWKRRAVGPARPRWLAPIADVLGGRGCVSRIRIDAPSSPACAVSAGGVVVTVIDDGTTSALTLCGAGIPAADALDQLVRLVTPA